MTAQFADRIALVTGGSSGIGRAAARAFAREGARVVIADVDREGGEETVGLIEDAGGEARLVLADVTRRADVERMVAETVDVCGGLDFAFNNAGIIGARADTHDYGEDEFDRVIGVNLKGVWLCLRAEIPRMLERGGGAIVNVGSVASFSGHASFSAYVASKHGVVGLTKTAALEYAGRGLRVNAVCPGLTRTPLTLRTLEAHPDEAEKMEAMMLEQQPAGRMATPEEIAAAAIWLCSDAASFVQGHMLVVDGGLLAR